MNHAQSLTIVQVNDSHSYLEPHPELFWGAHGADYRIAGGYARLATVINQIRQDRPGGVLVLDGGDTFHGTYPAVHSRGEALLPVLNAIGFDAMSAHWEFAYGPAHFRRLAARLDYPVLALNCYAEQSGKRVFDPYQVVERGGLRVGIIGLVSNIVDKNMPPAFSQGVYFTLGREELPECIAALRGQERVDLVVVLSHLGFPQDMQMAADVPGIDVIASSHTHNRLTRPAYVGHTLIIQSGCHGSFVGRLDLSIRDRVVVGYRHRLITVDEGIAPEPAMQARIDEILAPHRAMLDEVVGETATALNRNTVLEATMDNLLLQSLLHATQTPLAFSNGWRYGAPLPCGPVRVNDLWNIIPVNPPVSLVDLTGEELCMMLEENLENTFARNPYDQMGGYVKRALGLTLYAKIENPKGKRIQALFVQGEPVQPNRIYPATFVTDQGVPTQYGSNRRDLELHAVDALRAYFAAQSGPVEAELRGTVVVV
ncbi:MAG: bifunctional metallophosphatase/5'-nucleotidase [Chloroflexi bacterium]|nr:MAG: bifunctional metallophosphatase/5'-nucleotidase [Chloroflexota bacterium]